MSQLYDLFEEHPGDDELAMRAAYRGWCLSGRGVLSALATVCDRGQRVYQRTRLVGYTSSMSQRGRATAEADALLAAMRKQRVVM